MSGNGEIQVRGKDEEEDRRQEKREAGEEDGDADDVDD